MPKTSPDAARFTIVGSWTNGRAMNNVLEFLVEPGTGFTRAQALTDQAARIGTAWETNIIPICPNNYTATHVEFLDLDDINGPTGQATGSLPGTGGLAGASATPAVARLVTKSLLQGGRGQRAGRMYLPPPEEVDISEDGVLNGPAITRDQTGLSAFLTAVTVSSGAGATLTASPVVIQWPSISVQPPTKRVTDPDGVGVPEFVGTLTIVPEVATQRRRQRGD